MVAASHVNCGRTKQVSVGLEFILKKSHVQGSPRAIRGVLWKSEERLSAQGGEQRHTSNHAEGRDGKTAHWIMNDLRRTLWNLCVKIGKTVLPTPSRQTSAIANMTSAQSRVEPIDGYLDSACLTGDNSLHW
jgi:hypothetical protein